MPSTLEFVGGLGVVASQSMNILTIPSVLKIAQAKSTLSFPSFPLMIALTSAIHNIIYALVTWNMFVVLSSSITFTFNVIFLLVHYRYSRSRSAMRRELLLYPVLTVAISFFGVRYFSFNCASLGCLQSSRVWLGAVSTVISCVCYCGQLSTFRTIMRQRDASSISPWLTAGVAFRGLVWNTYAILLGDWFNFTSSAVGILSAIIQVVFLLKYHALKND